MTGPEHSLCSLFQHYRIHFGGVLFENHCTSASRDQKEKEKTPSPALSYWLVLTSLSSSHASCFSCHLHGLLSHAFFPKTCLVVVNGLRDCGGSFSPVLKWEPL